MVESPYARGDMGAHGWERKGGGFGFREIVRGADVSFYVLFELRNRQLAGFIYLFVYRYNSGLEPGSQDCPW